MADRERLANKNRVTNVSFSPQELHLLTSAGLTLRDAKVLMLTAVQTAKSLKTVTTLVANVNVQSLVSQTDSVNPYYAASNCPLVRRIIAEMRGMPE